MMRCGTKSACIIIFFDSYLFPRFATHFDTFHVCPLFSVAFAGVSCVTT
jgi:hypothetical protein